MSHSVVNASATLHQAATSLSLLQPYYADLPLPVQEWTNQLSETFALLERHLQQAATTSHLARMVAQSAQPDEILQVAVDQLHERLGVDRCLIFQAEPDQQMRIRYASHDTVDREAFLGASCGFCRDYRNQLSQGTAVVLSQIHDGLSSELTEMAIALRIRAILIVPLIHQQTCIGALSLHHCWNEREWTEDDIAFVQEVASYCAIAIRQSELDDVRFKALVDNIPGAVYRCPHASEWRGMFISDAVADIVGYPASDFAPSGTRDFNTLIHPDDVDLVMRVADEAIAARQPFTLEYRMLHADGSSRWVCDKGQGIFDDQGNFLCLDGVILDITDRKQTEEALRSTQDFLTKLLDYSPAPIYVTSADSKQLRLVNRAWEEFIGISQEEVIGRSLDDIMPTAVAQSFHQNNQQVIETETLVVAEEIVDYNDKRHYFYTVKFPMRDAQGRIEAVGGISIDITNRRVAEEALRQSEERFRQMAAHIQEVFWMADVNLSQVLYVSPAYEQVWGRTCESLYAQPQSFLDAVHPDDRDRVTMTVEQQRQAGFNVEYRIIKPDGSIRWIWEHTSPMPDRSGNLCYVVGVSQDITERKHVQDALAASEAKWRSLIQHGSDILCVMSADARIQYISPSIQTTLGYIPAELIDTVGFECVHPDDVALVAKTFEQLVAQPGSMVSLEYRFQHKNGDWQLLESTGSNLLDNPAVQGVVVNSRDITERKRTEVALQNLVEGTADVTGREFFPALVSHLAAALGICHALVSERVGDQLQTLAFWSNGELKPNFSYIPADIPCGIALIEGQYCCPQGLQERFPANPRFIQMQANCYLGVALLGASGQPIGNLCILDRQPLTNTAWAETILRIFAARAAAELERQRATEALQQLNQELEHRVEQRTAALQDSERRFRAIFNQTFQLIGLLQPDGTLVEGNQSVMEFIGAEQDAKPLDWVGRPIWDMPRWRSFPHIQAQLKSAIDQAAAGQFVRYEIDLPDASGAIATFDFSIKPVFDDANRVVLLIPEGRDISDRKKAERALQQQMERERLMMDIAQRIRQSLDLEEILNTTAEEVQQFLQVDRVVVYRFEANGKIHVIVESVRAERLLLAKPCTQDKAIADIMKRLYRPEQVYLIEDIHTAELEPHYVQFLEQLQVCSKLVVPIVQGQSQAADTPKLWGLLVAHQCEQPRQWHPWEAKLLQQLATQVAIAIQQADLYETIKVSLAEKELLLKEVHHRVKNNMQVISSIFSLQARCTSDPSVLSILADSRNRIQSMALIHEKLYQSDTLSNINFVDYIHNLTNSLFTSYSVNRQRIRLHLDIADVSLHLDTAIPCGLLINELISNSLKHAFPDNRQGKITLTLSLLSERQLSLMVQDDGVGFPAEFDLDKTNSLGLRLIRALTRQLQGTADLYTDNGAVFRITFSISK